MAEARRRYGVNETGCDDGQRFLLELEFVQLLANPKYLNWLAQNKHFEDNAFLRYLEYLKYWHLPQYAKFVVYPHALYFLDLLQSKEFRTQIANQTVAEFVHQQQHAFWANYHRNRLEAESKLLGDTEGGPDRQQ